VTGPAPGGPPGPGRPPEPGSPRAPRRGVAATDRLPRLLALLPWLRTHPGVRVDAAAAEFGISAEQLRADLSLLYFCGLPGQGPSDLIDIEFEGETVTVLDAQTLDRPPRLTGDEALALVVAARALADVPGLDRDAALERALAKLQAAVGAAGVAPGVHVGLATGREDPAVVATVRDALARQRRLRLRYLVERRDEVTEREVDPVTLHLTDGRLYLEAWDADREAMRLFRIDAVQAAQALESAAEPPPDVLPRDLAEGLFRPAPSDAAVTVELAPRARWVADAHPCESVEALGDGRLRVVLRTPDPGWLVRLVVRLGGAATVLDPPAVVAAVREAAVAGLAAYGATA